MTGSTRPLPRRAPHVYTATSTARSTAVSRAGDQGTAYASPSPASAPTAATGSGLAGQGSFRRRAATAARISRRPRRSMPSGTMDGAATLLVLPTGTGKTIVFAAVRRTRCAAGAASWSSRIAANCWNRPRIKSNGARGWHRLWKKRNRPVWDSWCRVVVGSVQSLQRPARLEQFPADYFGTIIIDEAHHAITDGYQRVLEHFPECKRTGRDGYSGPRRYAQPGRGVRFPRLRIQTYAGDPRGVPVPRSWPKPFRCSWTSASVGVSAAEISQWAELGTALDPYLEQIASEMQNGMRGAKNRCFPAAYQNEPEVPGHPQQQGVPCGRGKRAERGPGRNSVRFFKRQIQCPVQQHAADRGLGLSSV